VSLHPTQKSILPRKAPDMDFSYLAVPNWDFSLICVKTTEVVRIFSAEYSVSGFIPTNKQTNKQTKASRGVVFRGSKCTKGSSYNETSTRHGCKQAGCRRRQERRSSPSDSFNSKHCTNSNEEQLYPNPLGVNVSEVFLHTKESLRVRDSSEALFLVVYCDTSRGEARGGHWTGMSVTVLSCAKVCEHEP